MRSVCFTGHRNVKITPELKKRLQDTIVKCIENECSHFYAGGALGWDMLCEETVLELKKLYPQIKLYIIMPCPFEEQTEKWTEEQKAWYKKNLKAANGVSQIGKHYTKDCMKNRNEKLAACGDICICWCKNKVSGTGQTVRLARERNIPVINLAE